MPLDDPTTNPYLMHFLSSPSTVATFAALSLTAVVVAMAVPRRRFLVLATGISAAAVGGLTLAPSRGWTTLALTAHPLEVVRTALRPTVDDLWAWTVADGPANVALFIPLACCLGLLLRGPVRAFLIGVILSVAIESYQAATGTRIGTFTDIAANGLGALAGAALATVVLIIAESATGRPRRAPRTRPGHQDRPVEAYAGPRW